MPCDWEGNRTSGVALVHPPAAQGPSEMSTPPTLLMGYGTRARYLCFYPASRRECSVDCQHGPRFHACHFRRSLRSSTIQVREHQTSEISEPTSTDSAPTHPDHCCGLSSVVRPLCVYCVYVKRSKGKSSPYSITERRIPGLILAVSLQVT